MAFFAAIRTVVAHFVVVTELIRWGFGSYFNAH